MPPSYDAGGSRSSLYYARLSRTRRKRRAHRLAVAIDAIVLASFLRIRQDRVRLLNAQELACGALIPGDVRMVFERDTPKRRLDRHIVGSRADPQGAAIILEGVHRAPALRGRVRLPRGKSKPRAIGTGEPAFTGSPCPRLTYWHAVAIHATAKSRPRVGVLRRRTRADTAAHAVDGWGASA